MTKAKTPANTGSRVFRDYLPAIQEAEYLVSVECVSHLPYASERFWPPPTAEQRARREAAGGDHSCDRINITVEANSAVEALYKAANQVAQTLPDQVEMYARYLCGYEITIGCAYSCDCINGIGGEADSAADELFQAAMFDSRAREMHSLEW